MSQFKGSAGWIGLGAMGYHMAGHVSRAVAAAGGNLPLLVWNRTTSKAEAHVAEFSSCAAQKLSGLAECTVIFSCLPTSEEVANAAAQVAASRSSGSPSCTWVDCTSGDPDRTRKLAEELAPAGLILVDCPVSGGPRGAAAATLTAMLGGEEQLWQPALPLVRAFASKLELCGPVGSGMAVKAVNNALNAAHVLLGAEGLLALQKFGVDPAKALSVINKSSGRSLQTEVRLPEEVLSRRFNYGFKLGLMQKDCGIAAGIVRAGFPDAPLLLHACNAVAEAGKVQGPDADYTEVARWLEGLAGTELRAGEPESKRQRVSAL